MHPAQALGICVLDPPEDRRPAGRHWVHKRLLLLRLCLMQCAESCKYAWHSHCLFDLYKGSICRALAWIIRCTCNVHCDISRCTNVARYHVQWSRIWTVRHHCTVAMQLDKNCYMLHRSTACCGACRHGPSSICVFHLSQNPTSIAKSSCMLYFS